MSLEPPPPFLLAALLGPVTVVTRHVDIYESDGTTPWLLNAPFIDGSVTVSNARPERRMLDLTLGNQDGALRHFPGGFWYDKIIKTYRGVTRSAQSWEVQTGEFMIDNISEPNFPPKIQVTGRDYTKKCLLSKFPRATNFTADLGPEEVVRTIALNAGIPANKMILPFTGFKIGRDFLVERGSDRWKAMGDVAAVFNMQVFFDAQGYLVMREFTDPLTAPASWSFETGRFGNLVKWTKQTSDSRIRNHYGVSNGAADQVPLFVEAINTNPASPTRVAKLGDRYEPYDNPLFTSTTQMQTVADSLLRVGSQESFDLNMESIVFPWLDVDEVMAFADPNPNPGDPTSYLLTDLALPLKLGSMTGTGKRITVVG